MDTVWSGFLHRPDRLVHFVGDRALSWVCADDIAAVAAAALRQPHGHAGKTYPLAVEAMTLTELAAMLSQVTDRPVSYRPRPAADLFPIMEKQGAEPTYARGFTEYVAAIERGEIPLAGTVFDSVSMVTGRKPVGWREFAEKRKGQLAG